MASPLKSYLGRSIDLLRRSTAKVVKMDTTPRALPTTIFSFDPSADPEHPIDTVDHFGMGADSEVGGLSTCNLSLVPSSSTSPLNGAASTSGSTSTSASTPSHLAFHGYMSTRVPPSQQGKIRTGYAGFRNTSRPTLFGQDTWDLELYTHLKVTVGYRGWEGWRNRWVVNIGIDGRPKSDVFQHRLDIPPSPLSTSSRLPLDPLAPPRPTFTTVHLPLSSFVLIKKGQIAASPIPLPRSSIRTVGFALLGRDRGDDGEAAPVSQGLKGVSMGGWGRASAEEADEDPELKALLDEDQAARPASAQRVTEASRPNSGGYHRVGATEASQPTTISGETQVAAGAPSEEKEGYYELCIKSVQAVKWDPEADAPEEA